MRELSTICLESGLGSPKAYGYRFAEPIGILFLCGLKTALADRKKGLNLEFGLLKTNRFQKKWLTRAIFY
jgi:hypothetical protein